MSRVWDYRVWFDRFRPRWVVCREYYDGWVLVDETVLYRRATAIRMSWWLNSRRNPADTNQYRYVVVDRFPPRT